MMHQADTVCQSMLHACDMDCAKVSADDRAERLELEASRGGFSARKSSDQKDHRGRRPESRGADRENVSNPRAEINSY